MTASLRPAVFVDRDGTLMEDVPYLRDPAAIQLYPGVIDALKSLRKSGFSLVMITNQSGIGRGWIQWSEYEAVQRRLMELLRPVTMEAVYVCPDPPEIPSSRRKPAPGMVLEAAHELQLDLDKSWFIGDKSSDIACAVAAGVAGIQVATGEGTAQRTTAAAHFAATFKDATTYILRHVAR